MLNSTLYNTFISLQMLRGNRFMLRNFKVTSTLLYFSYKAIKAKKCIGSQALPHLGSILLH